VAVSPSTDSSSMEPLDVDLGEVAVGERRLAVFEVGEAIAQLVDLRRDVVVADVGLLDLDAQLVVALDGEDGTYLDHGVELDVALFLAGDDVDLRRRDDVDVFGDDGLGVVLGERVAQCLVARHLGAETRLEQATRRLAGTEARHLDVLRQLAERGIDGPFEVFRRDRDVQADLVVFEGFDRRGE